MTLIFCLFCCLSHHYSFNTNLCWPRADKLFNIATLQWMNPKLINMTCSKLDPYQNRFYFFALDWIVWISIVSSFHSLYHVCCLQLQTSMQITNNASFLPSILTIADIIILIPINTCLCTHIHSSFINNSISCATTVNQVNFVWNVIRIMIINEVIVTLNE